MRKLVPVLILVMTVSMVSATGVEDERVEVDLESNEVEVSSEVSSVTGDVYTYITSYPVRNLEAEKNGQSIECSIDSLQIGSQILCPVNGDQNFSINLKFQGADFTERINGVRDFMYTQQIYRPTDSYSLRVILPEGAVVGDEETIDPGNGNIGSNGRRIFVEWDLEPELGETLNFGLEYQRIDQEIGLPQAGAVILLAVVTTLISAIAYRAMNKENITEEFEELTDDQVEVIEMLRDRDGEMLQSDLVKETDFSKAKVSSIVKELKEEGLVEKKKEGRSNRLSIPVKYRI